MNLGLLCAMTNDEKSNTSKALNNLLVIIAFGVTVLALYLAIRDMGMQVHTMTKVWVFLLALVEPFFYVILHGISTSLSGISFFQSSPLVGGGGSTMSGSPLSDLSASNILSGVKKAASDSLSSLGSVTPSSLVA